MIVDEGQVVVTQPRRIVGIKGKSPTVLVVDDHPENRAVLVDLLAPLGFEMFEAGNGQQGFVIATQRRPAAIITDLIMPEMDGFALIRQIRQSEALRETVIIATSASVYEEDRQKSLDTGSDAFLPKPVEVDRLLEQLHKLLHIKWRYQEPVDTAGRLLETADFILPPADTLERLLDLSDLGDIEEFQKHLTALTELDEQYTPFATKFHQLAWEFKLDTISELLEEYLER